MRTWLQYAAAGALVVIVVAGALTFIVLPSSRGAIWFGAGLAYVLQLGAFAALLRFKQSPQLFLLGWAFGIGLRFLSVVVVALWLSRTHAFPMEAALLSQVGFLMIMLFMEPLFFKGSSEPK